MKTDKFNAEEPVNTTKQTNRDVAELPDDRRDPAKNMLLRNSVDVLRAFAECSDEVQKGIVDMGVIISDESTDDDEKAAAEITLMEALYPRYHGEGLGIDSCHYDKIQRETDPDIESTMDNEESAFAENLSRFMQEKHLTQADLAAKVGVGQPAIANMLARQCRPQRRTIEKVAKALSVDPRALWPFIE
jgi:lambda repressor-like predicted transcriptional regulator